MEQDQVMVLFYPGGQLDISPFELVVKVQGFQMVFQGDAQDCLVSDRLAKLTMEDVPRSLLWSLKEARRKTKITQQGLVYMAGTKISYISKIENVL